MNFAQNLKTYRKKRKLSRQDMADKLNMAAASYGFYEQGKTKPDVTKLVIIARVLNVSPNELLDFHYDEFEYCKSLWELYGYKIEEDEITGMIEVLFNSTVEEVSVKNGKVEVKKMDMLPFNNKDEFIKLTHYVEKLVNKEKEKARSHIFKTVIQNSQKIAKHQVIEENGVRSYKMV